MGWLSAGCQLNVWLSGVSTVASEKTPGPLHIMADGETTTHPLGPCRLRSVGPTIITTLGMVSARTLFCFRWICSVGSKVFHGPDQGNLCPVLCIHREAFNVGWPLIKQRGIIIWYLRGVHRKKQSIGLQKSIKEHGAVSIFPPVKMTAISARQFLMLIIKQMRVVVVFTSMHCDNDFKTHETWWWQ